MHNTYAPGTPFLVVQRYGINSACGREIFGLGTGCDGPVGGVNRLIRVGCVGPTRCTTGALLHKGVNGKFRDRGETVNAQRKDGSVNPHSLPSEFEGSRRTSFCLGVVAQCIVH